MEIVTDDKPDVVRIAKDLVATLRFLRTETEKRKNTKAGWDLRVKALTQNMYDAIEADQVDGDQKCNMIAIAYQEVREAEFGRKAEMTVLMDSCRVLEQQLNKQLENINQMSLDFGK